MDKLLRTPDGNFIYCTRCKGVEFDRETKECLRCKDQSYKDREVTKEELSNLADNMPLTDYLKRTKTSES